MKKNGALLPLVLALCLLAPSAPARAAEGDLDPTFGSGGVTFTDFFELADAGTDMVLLPDGRIVEVGLGFDLATHFDFAVARYSADGQTDPAQPGGDRVLIDFADAGESRTDEAWGVARQADGKLVVAGLTAYGTNSDFALVRLDGDLRLDPGFGDGGRVRTDFGGFDRAEAVAIQPDRKILVVGSSSRPDNTYAIALARYNPDGTLDAGFGTGGRLVTTLGRTKATANDVALQPDGKILIVGHALPRGQELAVARLHPDGRLDASFGTGGVALLATLPGLGEAVTLTPDGRIVVAGMVSRGGKGDFAVWRLLPDGALDPAFGDHGRVVTDFANGSDWARAVALTPDGRILVGGTTETDPTDPFSGDFALALYDSKGRLVPGFGSGGLVTNDFSGAFDRIEALVPVPGRRVLAGGRSDADSSDFALARYLGGARCDDNPAPQITGLKATPAALWPVSRKMVKVDLAYQVADSCDRDTVTCALSVASNQEVGATAPDWIVVNPKRVRLRAERSGSKNRLYTLTVTCTDGAGLSTRSSVNVTVPRKKP